MTAITIETPDYDSATSGSSSNGGKTTGWSKKGLFDRDDTIMQSSSVAAAHVAIRLGFIRKVLGILAVQLVFTTIIGAIFVFTPGLKGVVQQWSWMLLLGFVLSIGLLIGMMVKRHETPTNYILLAAWTIVQAYTVGVIASTYDKDIVIMAVFLTAAVVVSLSIYTVFTKRDFSSWGAGLFSVLLVLLIGGFLQMFLLNETLDFVLALGGAILFSLFIIYDLQDLMHRLSPEEYIMATINLYLDIINLFLHLLRLLQHFRRD